MGWEVEILCQGHKADRKNFKARMISAYLTSGKSGAEYRYADIF